MVGGNDVSSADFFLTGLDSAQEGRPARLRNQWFAMKKDYAWPSVPCVSKYLKKIEVVEDCVAMTASIFAKL